MKSNGVKYITSAPYHPATNGLAERSVQTFKQALRSMEESSKAIEELAKFLITCRNTPHSTTGEPSTTYAWQANTDTFRLSKT
jgi:transposase InsO family protein